MAITPEKRAKMEDLIYKFFTAFDKSGTNTNYYKELFGVMSDKQFEQYFDEFFKNDKAYLILNIVDYEHSITMEDIERAAKVIKIPLFENVYTPHITIFKIRYALSFLKNSSKYCSNCLSDITPNNSL